MPYNFHAIEYRDHNYPKLLFHTSALILKSTAVPGEVESVIGFSITELGLRADIDSFPVKFRTARAPTLVHQARFLRVSCQTLET